MLNILNKNKNEFIKTIEDIAGSENVLSDYDELYVYSTDSTNITNPEELAQAVIFAKDVNQVSKIMKYAYENGYDIAVQFDGDGQHQAMYLKDLIKEVEDGNCNISVGSRFVTKKKPKSMRMLGSMLISGAIRLTTGKKIKDPTSRYESL